MFKKGIALLLVHSLVFPSIGWSLESQRADRAGGLTVPSEAGRVLAATPGASPRVFVIQDLHCHAEVQRNIGRLLEHLQRHNGTRLVCVEGASGEVDVSKLATFPVLPVRRQISDYLLKQGKITGPEHAAANGLPMRICGIEDPRLYAENQRQAKSFLADENQGLLIDLREHLDALKARIYNPALSRLDCWMDGFRSGKLSVEEMAAGLANAARTGGISLGAFPEVARWRKEGDGSRIDADRLFEQLLSLDRTLRQRAYRTPMEADFDELVRRLDLVEHLLNISATPDELKEYRQDPGTFQVRVFAEFLRKLNPETGSLDLAELAPLDEAMRQAGEFYATADRRSRSFVDNLLAEMSRTGSGPAVLIVGGFHTADVLSLLEARSVPYAAIKPALTHLDWANPYFSLLKGQRSPLEKLLAQNQNILSTPSNFPNQAPAALGEADRFRVFDTLLDSLLKIALVHHLFRGGKRSWPAVRNAFQEAVTAWLKNNDRIGILWEQAEGDGEVLLIPLTLGFQAVVCRTDQLDLGTTLLRVPLGDQFEIGILTTAQAEGLRAKYIRSFKSMPVQGLFGQQTWERLYASLIAFLDNTNDPSASNLRNRFSEYKLAHIATVLLAGYFHWMNPKEFRAFMKFAGYTALNILDAAVLKKKKHDGEGLSHLRRALERASSRLQAFPDFRPLAEEVLEKLEQLERGKAVARNLHGETAEIRRIQVVELKAIVPSPGWEDAGAFFRLKGKTGIIYLLPGMDLETALVHEFFENIVGIPHELAALVDRIAAGQGPEKLAPEIFKGLVSLHQNQAMEPADKKRWSERLLHGLQDLNADEFAQSWFEALGREQSLIDPARKAGVLAVAEFVRQHRPSIIGPMLALLGKAIFPHTADRDAYAKKVLFSHGYMLLLNQWSGAPLTESEFEQIFAPWLDYVRTSGYLPAELVTRLPDYQKDFAQPDPNEPGFIIKRRTLRAVSKNESAKDRERVLTLQQSMNFGLVCVEQILPWILRWEKQGGSRRAFLKILEQDNLDVSFIALMLGVLGESWSSNLPDELAPQWADQFLHLKDLAEMDDDIAPAAAKAVLKSGAVFQAWDQFKPRQQDALAEFILAELVRNFQRLEAQAETRSPTMLRAEEGQADANQRQVLSDFHGYLDLFRLAVNREPQAWLKRVMNGRWPAGLYDIFLASLTEHLDDQNLWKQNRKMYLNGNTQFQKEFADSNILIDFHGEQLDKVINALREGLPDKLSLPAAFLLLMCNQRDLGILKNVVESENAPAPLRLLAFHYFLLYHSDRIESQGGYRHWRYQIQHLANQIILNPVQDPALIQAVDAAPAWFRSEWSKSLLTALNLSSHITKSDVVHPKLMRQAAQSAQKNVPYGPWLNMSQLSGKKRHDKLMEFSRNLGMPLDQDQPRKISSKKKRSGKIYNLRMLAWPLLPLWLTSLPDQTKTAMAAWVSDQAQTLRLWPGLDHPYLGFTLLLFLGVVFVLAVVQGTPRSSDSRRASESQNPDSRDGLLEKLSAQTPAQLIEPDPEIVQMLGDYLGRLDKADSTAEVFSELKEWFHTQLKVEGVGIYNLTPGAQGKYLYRVFFREARIPSRATEEERELPADSEKAFLLRASVDSKTGAYEKGEDYLYISDRLRASFVNPKELLCDCINFLPDWSVSLKDKWIKRIMSDKKITAEAARTQLTRLERMYPGSVKRVNEILWLVLRDQNGLPVGLVMLNNWETGRPLLKPETDRRAIFNLLGLISRAAINQTRFLTQREQLWKGLETAQAAVRAINDLYNQQLLSSQMRTEIHDVVSAMMRFGYISRIGRTLKELPVSETEIADIEKIGKNISQLYDQIYKIIRAVSQADDVLLISRVPDRQVDVQGELDKIKKMIRGIPDWQAWHEWLAGFSQALYAIEPEELKKTAQKYIPPDDMHPELQNLMWQVIETRLRQFEIRSRIRKYTEMLMGAKDALNKFKDLPGMLSQAKVQVAGVVGKLPEQLADLRGESEFEKTISKLQTYLEVMEPVGKAIDVFKVNIQRVIEDIEPPRHVLNLYQTLTALKVDMGQEMEVVVDESSVPKKLLQDAYIRINKDVWQITVLKQIGGNAIKFQDAQKVDKKPKLIIRPVFEKHGDKDMIVLHISDNGPGVKVWRLKDLIRSLEDPGFKLQADPDLRSGYSSGTGVPAIHRVLLEAGGKLTAEPPVSKADPESMTTLRLKLSLPRYYPDEKELALADVYAHLQKVLNKTGAGEELAGLTENDEFLSLFLQLFRLQNTFGGEAWDSLDMLKATRNMLRSLNRLENLSKKTMLDDSWAEAWQTWSRTPQHWETLRPDQVIKLGELFSNLEKYPGLPQLLYLLTLFIWTGKSDALMPLDRFRLNSMSLGYEIRKFNEKKTEEAEALDLETASLIGRHYTLLGDYLLGELSPQYVAGIWGGLTESQRKILLLFSINIIKNVGEEGRLFRTTLDQLLEFEDAEPKALRLERESGINKRLRLWSGGVPKLVPRSRQEAKQRMRELWLAIKGQVPEEERKKFQDFLDTINFYHSYFLFTRLSPGHLARVLFLSWRLAEVTRAKWVVFDNDRQVKAFESWLDHFSKTEPGLVNTIHSLGEKLVAEGTDLKLEGLPLTLRDEQLMFHLADLPEPEAAGPAGDEKFGPAENQDTPKLELSFWDKHFPKTSAWFRVGAEEFLFRLAPMLLFHINVVGPSGATLLLGASAIVFLYLHKDKGWTPRQWAIAAGVTFLISGLYFASAWAVHPLDAPWAEGGISWLSSSILHLLNNQIEERFPRLHWVRLSWSQNQSPKAEIEEAESRRQGLSERISRTLAAPSQRKLLDYFKYFLFPPSERLPGDPRDNLGLTLAYNLRSMGSYPDLVNNAVQVNPAVSFRRLLSLIRRNALYTHDVDRPGPTYYLFGNHRTSTLSRWTHGLDYTELKRVPEGERVRYMNAFIQRVSPGDPIEVTEVGFSETWDDHHKLLIPHVRIAFTRNGQQLQWCGGYNTKHSTYIYSHENKDHTIKHSETYGNPFSPAGMDELERVFSDAELRKITEEAHAADAKVMVDFYAWRSPEYLTEDNYQYFLHQELAPDEDPDTVFAANKFKGIILTLPSGLQIYAETRPEALDQLVPNYGRKHENPITPEQQFENECYEYWFGIYQRQLRHQVYLGVDAFRIDLVNEFDYRNQQQMLFDLVDDAVRYAAITQGRKLYFVLETYPLDGRNMRDKFRAWNAHWDYPAIKTYFEEPFKNVVDRKGTSGMAGDSAWLANPDGYQSEMAFFSNYDIYSLLELSRQWGLHLSSAQELLMLWARSGVNIMVDFARDYLGYGGELMPPPGGHSMMLTDYQKRMKDVAIDPRASIMFPEAVKDKQRIYDSHKHLDAAEFERWSHDDLEKQLRASPMDRWWRWLAGSRVNGFHTETDRANFFFPDKRVQSVDLAGLLNGTAADVPVPEAPAVSVWQPDQGLRTLAQKVENLSRELRKLDQQLADLLHLRLKAWLDLGDQPGLQALAALDNYENFKTKLAENVLTQVKDQAMQEQRISADEPEKLREYFNQNGFRLAEQYLDVQEGAKRKKLDAFKEDADRDPADKERAESLWSQREHIRLALEEIQERLRTGEAGSDTDDSYREAGGMENGADVRPNEPVFGERNTTLSRITAAVAELLFLLTPQGLRQRPLGHLLLPWRNAIWAVFGVLMGIWARGRETAGRIRGVNLAPQTLALRVFGRTGQGKLVRRVRVLPLQTASWMEQALNPWGFAVQKDGRSVLYLPEALRAAVDPVLGPFRTQWAQLLVDSTRADPVRVRPTGGKLGPGPHPDQSGETETPVLPRRRRGFGSAA